MISKNFFLVIVLFFLSCSSSGDDNSDINTDKQNSPPVVQSLTVTSDGSQINIVLQGSDPDNDDLTYSIVSNPTKVQLICHATMPHIRLLQMLMILTHLPTKQMMESLIVTLLLSISLCQTLL